MGLTRVIISWNSSIYKRDRWRKTGYQKFVDIDAGNVLITLGTRIRYPEQQLLSSPKTFKIREKDSFSPINWPYTRPTFLLEAYYTAVTLGLHSKHSIAPSYTLIGRDSTTKETFRKSIADLKKSLWPQIIPLQYLRKLGYDVDFRLVCGLRIRHATAWSKRHYW